jgi:hypothetical protein
MFSWEAVESLLFIGVITAAIVWHGIVQAHKEDRDGGVRGKS